MWKKWVYQASCDKWITLKDIHIERCKMKDVITLKDGKRLKLKRSPEGRTGVKNNERLKEGRLFTLISDRGILYSALKRKDIPTRLPHGWNWRICLSEINQSCKDKYYMIPFIWGVQSSQFVETESIVVVAKNWVERVTGNCYLMSIELWFCKMKNFWNSASWLYGSVNMLNTAELFI